jgi:cytidylate kinase
MRVIAIDGPAGAGKSTLGRALAGRLGLDYLDTGAMYRAVAFAALRRGVDPEDRDVIGRLVDGIELSVDGPVVVDGVDATVEIRGPEVTRAVTPVAANPAVRTELTRRMREWADVHGGGVIEGRDIGTVVFPDAELKLFITARPEIRSARRHREVTDLAYDEVAASMAQRDAADLGRTNAPLAEAPDAVTIDTSDRTIDDLVGEIMTMLGER